MDTTSYLDLRPSRAGGMGLGGGLELVTGFRPALTQAQSASVAPHKGLRRPLSTHLDGASGALN